MTTATKPLSEHGTTARAKGRPAMGVPRCPCPLCRAAERAYAKRCRVLNATGRTLSVPVEPVAAHLDTLFAAGAGWVQIADLAQVSQSSLSKIRNRQQAVLRRGVADRILGIRPGQGLPERRSIPTLGAVRRVRALMAIGHTVAAIGAAADLNHTVMHGLVNGRLDTFWATTDARVAAAYATLAHRPGSNVRARNRARREGWYGPLAWDGNIDDPNAEPDTTGVGSDAPRTRDFLRNDEIRHLAGFQLATHEIAKRVGLDEQDVSDRLAKWRNERTKQVAA